MNGPTTYSFQDLTGAMSHPLVGAFIFSGDKMGVGDISVSMTTEKTVLDTSADGGVMMSWIPGDAGTMSIQVQQTSIFHKWLLNAFNLIKDAPSDQKFLMGCFLRNVATGTSHVCNGMGFQKIPDMPYQQQGQRVTWTFLCGDIQSLVA